MRLKDAIQRALKKQGGYFALKGHPFKHAGLWRQRGGAGGGGGAADLDAFTARLRGDPVMGRRYG